MFTQYILTACNSTFPVLCYSGIVIMHLMIPFVGSFFLAYMGHLSVNHGLFRLVYIIGKDLNQQGRSVFAGIA